MAFCKGFCELFPTYEMIDKENLRQKGNSFPVLRKYFPDCGAAGSRTISMLPPFGMTSFESSEEFVTVVVIGKVL